MRAAAETDYLLQLMPPLNRQKVAQAIQSGRRTVGAVYRRTRPDEHGVKRQRAEVRFDDIAGCLRTPAGGSSRQTILVVVGKSLRSRLLSPREAARLMGLSDEFRLPPEFCREVQPPASLKGLDIPSRRAVFVPRKPSRMPAFGKGNPTFR